MGELIVFDVDLVLGDGNVAPKCTHLAGLDILVGTLLALGYELHAWSAGGEAHARAVVAHGGLQRAFHAYHDKPPYPPSERDALAILGRRPALQIDDDLSERVADWPFMFADNWYKLLLG